MRISRFLAAAGLGSRRACEGMVQRGEVTVDGERIDTLATVVDPIANKVCCGGKRIRLPEPQYIVLNKPRAYTCSARDTHAQHLVTELVPESLGRLFTVGRLDRDSEGVILLTNDGDFAERIAHPRYGVTKTYRVWCRGTVNESVLGNMRKGVMDDGDHLQPQQVRIVSQRQGAIVLECVFSEGKKREVRRFCAAFGLTVQRLLRVAVGRVTAQSLAAGQWRHLTAAEMTELTGKPNDASATRARQRQKRDRDHTTAAPIAKDRPS